MVSPRAVEFRVGMLALAPMLLSVVPFSLIYDMLAISAGMPAWLTMAMSAIVLGGASQMILVQLWASSTPALMIAATVSMANLRHALCSTSIAPALTRLPRRWKWLAAYLLTGEVFATMDRRVVTAQADSAEAAYRHWYFLGADVALWSGWQTSTTVGVVLGTQVPTSWPLDFFLPLTFIAIMVPALHAHVQLAAALAGAALTVARTGWPHKLGLMSAACVDIAVGAPVECLLARPSDKGAAA